MTGKIQGENSAFFRTLLYSVLFKVRGTRLLPGSLLKGVVYSLFIDWIELSEDAYCNFPGKSEELKIREPTVPDTEILKSSGLEVKVPNSVALPKVLGDRRQELGKLMNERICFRNLEMKLVYRVSHLLGMGYHSACGSFKTAFVKKYMAKTAAKKLGMSVKFLVFETVPCPYGTDELHFRSLVSLGW